MPKSAEGHSRRWELLAAEFRSLREACEVFARSWVDQRARELPGNLTRMLESARKGSKAARALTRIDDSNLEASAKLSQYARRAAGHVRDYARLALSRDSDTGQNHPLRLLIHAAQDLQAKLGGDSHPGDPASGSEIGLAHDDSSIFHRSFSQAQSAPAEDEPASALISPHLLSPAAAAALDESAGRILLVDDNPKNVELVTRFLQARGHLVVGLTDGTQVLPVLRRQPFDLVLLDLVMPEVSGYDVLKLVRSHIEFRNLQIVILSGVNATQDIVECLKLGADDFLTKPIEDTLLTARIQSCLQKRRSQLQTLEQFFSPSVAQELLDYPDKLHTTIEREITVLFCDIRGFSTVSARLKSPEMVVRWVNGVMEALTECILGRSGVVVDFIGDEIFAMWGAPEMQPNHAQLACEAALDMWSKLPALNAKWRSVIGQDMAFGIGINTGVARVGNVGTCKRFKYGPLGNTVNLGSRIQGATKFTKADILLTHDTFSRLDGPYNTRRVAKLQVVNIPQPVDVYQLAPRDAVDWPHRKQMYEDALALFEKSPNDLEASIRRLGQLIQTQGAGGPKLSLLSRITACLVNPSRWDPVWKLEGK